MRKRPTKIAKIKAAALACKNLPYREIYHCDRYHIVGTEPQCRMVRFGKKYQYYLSFPYMSWASFNGIELYVGFSNKPIRSAKDVLYPPPLPNFSKFHICLGKDFKLGTPIHVLMERFWSTRFAPPTPYSFSMWNDGWNLLFKSSLKSLENWQAMSKSNPMGILEVDWAVFPQSFYLY